MMNESNLDPLGLPKKDWLIRFLNLPPAEQIEFLHRESLEESIRKEIEKKVFTE